MEDKKKPERKGESQLKKKYDPLYRVQYRVANEIGRHSAAYHLNRISLIINNQKLFPSSKKRNMSTRVCSYFVIFYQTYFAKNPPILRSY